MNNSCQHIKHLNFREHRLSGIFIPCGTCEDCRKNYVDQSVIRCLHELHMAEHRSVFVTLTIADEHMPKGLNHINLVIWIKKEFRDFRRRDDKWIKEYYGRKTTYFQVIEFGKKNGRIHIHYILFGHNYPDTKELRDRWNKGYVMVKGCTPENILYVSKYLNKSVTEIDGIAYQFKPGELKSQSPGLGFGYLKKYGKQLLNAGYINYPISFQQDGKRVTKNYKLRIIKPYRDKMKKLFPKEYQAFVNKRQDQSLRIEHMSTDAKEKVIPGIVKVYSDKLPQRMRYLKLELMSRAAYESWWNKFCDDPLSPLMNSKYRDLHFHQMLIDDEQSIETIEQKIRQYFPMIIKKMEEEQVEHKENYAYQLQQEEFKSMEQEDPLPENMNWIQTKEEKKYMWSRFENNQNCLSELYFNPSMEDINEQIMRSRERVQKEMPFDIEEVPVRQQLFVFDG